MSIGQARKQKLLTQKDLMLRWGASIRTIQRARKEYGLEPVDFYGINPLFTERDILRVEAARLKRGLERMKRQRRQQSIGGILTLRQLRARKGKQ